MSFQLWVLVKEVVLKSAPEKWPGRIIRTEMTQVLPTLI